MHHEKNTGINQLGVVAEVFAGSFIGPGIWNGNPYEIAIGGTIAAAPIAVDFVAKFREQKKQSQNKKSENNG